ASDWSSDVCSSDLLSIGEQGGGLCIQGGHATISNCTFMGNVAGQEGGAIANRATGGEQDVSINPANTVIQNTRIANNTAAGAGGGGGIWNNNSSLTLLADAVSFNNATSGIGGGISNNNG